MPPHDLNVRTASALVQENPALNWRAVALTLIDWCGARSTAARRRTRVFETVLQLRRLWFLWADRLLPVRRRALRVRTETATALREVVAERSESSSAPGAWSPGTVGSVHGLRVALFIPSFLRGQGGAEKVAGQLADVLVAAGAEVDVVCRDGGGRSRPYALDERVLIQQVDEHDDAGLAALGERRYTVLVCFGMAHFYRRIPHVANLLGAPFVIQECSNPDFITRQLLAYTDARSWFEAVALRQAVLAHAAAVRLTSPRYEESVARSLRPAVFAFYNAFRLPASAVSLEEPAHKIICVGAFKNSNKNGIAALDGFLRFAQDHPDWEFVSYGENAFEAEFANRLRRFPGAQVRDAGVVRDVASIYGDAYALIIPSFEEGLPNVVVEALSFGVPCIGFRDCTAVAQLIEHGDNGLLVERADPSGLSAALSAMAEPATRRALSAGARAFAARHFDVDVWTRNWLWTIRCAAAGMDRDGIPRLPPAQDPGSATAGQWRALLNSYRAIA